jgi:hypothetical protein
VADLNRPDDSLPILSSCCAPEKQDRCCEPADKAKCCPPGDQGCGCQEEAKP